MDAVEILLSPFGMARRLRELAETDMPKQDFPKQNSG
jgi:hypothetical protein